MPLKGQMCVSKNEFIYEGDADEEEMLQAFSEKSEIYLRRPKTDRNRSGLLDEVLLI